MKIKIICVGNIKDKNILNIFENYFNKIKHFINVEYIVLKEEKVIDELNNSLIKICLKNEAKKIINKIESNSFTFITCINGKQYNSIDFSNLIKNKINDSTIKSINFIVGSSYGLDSSIYQINNSIKISFSQLTLPHQLFQVVIAEQIYRSLTIINNQKYHK